MRLLHLLFSKSNQIPRWFILLFDIALCSFAYILAVVIRYSLGLPADFFFEAISVMPIVLLVKGVTINFFRLQKFVLRHTSVQDAVRIFYAMGSAFIFLFIIDAVHHYFPSNSIHLIPFGVLFLDLFFSIFFLSAYRAFIKLTYIRISSHSDDKKTNYAVYGGGTAGLTTKRKLEQESAEGIKVVAFFDEEDGNQRKILEGIKIFGGLDLESVLTRFEVKQLVIADPNLSIAKKQDIIERCLNLNVIVRTVPPVSKWINGELSFKQMKQVRIEDLIERDVIQLNKEAIEAQVNGKVVMVTGAGGSIGSEMVRQLLQFKPAKLVCIDSSEIKLYELDAEIRGIHSSAADTFAEIVVADVTIAARMINVFETFRPSIIYHAAAYKHVPLMEDNPSEAIRVNVNGTRILADLALQFQVERFVMVSTDKAVNPTNVMGASKRIAEIYVQALSEEQKRLGKESTKFITTRFGNVLGSSGSVIPKFRKQIEEGGPITVTHPDITRYFMTIPEACQLVLEAGNMGKGGEIFIFDMGKSTRIVDLAKKMVKLSGLVIGKDIQIVYSGLRPGEKIFEELLNDKENSLPTHHEKIMIGKVRTYDFGEVNRRLNELVESYNCQDNMVIVAKMKAIVPEFLSKNSIFESLDNNVQLPNSSDLKEMLMQ
ncbi:MAG: nucleoside-diphosphate sugar epimerase/dehydratase [bacterium]|nr:nucleoside-diphosphate sugar epimerase/dehydratase [bacterium]